MTVRVASRVRLLTTVALTAPRSPAARPPARPTRPARFPRPQPQRGRLAPRQRGARRALPRQPARPRHCDPLRAGAARDRPAHPGRGGAGNRRAAQSEDRALLGAYGRALADAGNFKQALDVLERAHSPDQPDWRILSVQGAVMDQMGRHARSAALLRERAARSCRTSPRCCPISGSPTRSPRT